MPTNDIQLIADTGGANVLSQADYLALTDYLANGFRVGIVPSVQLNKTLRQTALMAYVLAQYVVNASGQSVLDNGTPATIIANLLAAIQASAVASTFVTQPFGDTSEKAATDLFVQRAVSAVGGYYQDTGSVANAYVVATIPPWTASTYPNGFSIRFRTTRANTGASTLSAGTPGPFSVTREGGGPLEPGDIPVGSISTVTFSTASSSWVYNGAVASDFLDSPVLRGTPTTPTATLGDSSHLIANTEFVATALALASVNATPLTFTDAGRTLPPGNYTVDTTDGAFSVFLSTPLTGFYSFIDAANTWGAKPFTVNGNGHNIGAGLTETIALAGATSTFLADVSDQQFYIEARPVASFWRCI